MPNSGFIQIWLQRMLKANLDKYSFSEKMCELYNAKISLWNNGWIKGKRMPKILNNTSIFQKDEFEKLDKIIANNEINIFNDYD